MTCFFRKLKLRLFLEKTARNTFPPVIAALRRSKIPNCRSIIARPGYSGYSSDCAAVTQLLEEFALDPLNLIYLVIAQ
jgi:hypothetical protein